MKGPHTHFILRITTPSDGTTVLRGDVKAKPDTFKCRRAVVALRRAFPFKGHTKIIWSEYDGTDNPPINEGTTYKTF